MKVQKRNGVFETNSSSVHSLSFAKSGRKKNHIQMNKAGFLVANFGVFSCSGTFYTQEDKLSYLATCAWYLTGCPTDLEYMYDSYVWGTLEDAAKSYVDGCKGIRVSGFNRGKDGDEYSYGEDAPYIDHQSVPNYTDDMIVDFYDRDALIDFIWNDYISLKCSRD